jgi:cytoskeletal protein CcmA (bactofilin family)
MFKRRRTKQPKIETLIGAKTRINGDVEFCGGFHLDGFINGNVRGDASGGAVLSVSEQGCIEGSVSVPRVVLNGIVKGDIEACDRVELGPKARVMGNVHYTTIETAVGAQINGKLLHKAVSGAGQAEALRKDDDPGRKEGEPVRKLESVPRKQEPSL